MLLVLGPQSSTVSMVQVLLEPAKRFPPPQPLILRLPNPVPLIGKINQPTRHSLSLQGREERQTFGVGDAIIQLADNYQMRRVKIRREKMRRPAPVDRIHRRLVPVRPAEFPVAEPDLLGGAVHVLEIVDAGVSEQRLAPVRVTR